jgi:hypothetical protein
MDRGGQKYYEAEVARGGKIVDIRVSPEGKFLGETVEEADEAQSEPAQKPAKAGDWQSTFNVDKKDMAAKGKNPYFILQPGYTLHYKSDKGTMTIAVLPETKLIDGVKCAVVVETEVVGGNTAEITRDYFAIDKKTKDVYYMGEDVDVYKDGKVTGHGGSWLSGVKGAKFGLMMPAKPQVGQKFYQEQAPKVAMDRCEIVAVDKEITTPAGTFKKCVHAKDSSSLESGSSDKIYAPGVGMVKDDEFVLVKIEKPKKKAKKPAN